MLFALLCKDKPGHLNVRVETRPTHVDYLNKLNAEGKLAMAGPFLDAEGQANGSLVIVKAETADEARAIRAAKVVVFMCCSFFPDDGLSLVTRRACDGQATKACRVSSKRRILRERSHRTHAYPNRAEHA